MQNKHSALICAAAFRMQHTEQGGLGILESEDGAVVTSGKPAETTICSYNLKVYTEKQRGTSAGVCLDL